MKLLKCPVCGGQLESSRSGLKMTCPFCDAVLETTDDDAKDKKKNKDVFDPEMLVVEDRIKKELSSDNEDKEAAVSLRTMIYCMKEFETPDKIEKYMRKYITGSDMSAIGINEEPITKVMPRFASELTSDEKVILYCEKGIIFRCKEFMLVTNKRMFFATKKAYKAVFFEDIDKLELHGNSGCPLWEVNGDYEKTIPAIGDGTVQGALLAYCFLSAFKKDPDRDRIHMM